MVEKTDRTRHTNTRMNLRSKGHNSAAPDGQYIILYIVCPKNSENTVNEIPDGKWKSKNQKKEKSFP